MEKHILVTCEKPAQALKIATAIADATPKKKLIDKVAYYELTCEGKKIIVASAVGHLFTLSENKKSSTYPVFDISWKPSYLVSKKAKFTKKYYDLLITLAKNSSTFVNACDVDMEGELIFKNILELIYKEKNAKRMYFSTLTKDDLINSFKDMKPEINVKLAAAGEARHFLDYFWGISSSRALTLAIKNATSHYKIMSTGRVQGPTLKLIVNREREISSFKSVPYWEIEMVAYHGARKIVAGHKNGKFWNKEGGNKVIEQTKNHNAIVQAVEKRQFVQIQPNPFDLTSLQMESYRVLRNSPKETLEIAQILYLSGYISYPRTSSNQFPRSLNYKKIIQSLLKQKQYHDLAKSLLEQENLEPNNGRKTDPAHPAIYPTGEIPGKINEKQLKVYDLIVKRTLSTFAPVAKRESVTIEFDVNKEIFISKGTTTIEKGWHLYYYPYVQYNEEELPDLNKGQELIVQSIKIYDKETQPPKRFTSASLIKVLEKHGLGTKATRSVIIDTLYERQYVVNESIQATLLGIKTIETLERYCSDIIDEKLTRHFEKEMDHIQDSRKSGSEIIDEAKKVLTKIFKKFKENEINIGKALFDAKVKTQNQQSIVGKCTLCNNDLRITYSKKNKQFFVACSNYPDCKNTFSVPKNALIKPTKKSCKECGFPTVLVIRRARRPFEFCLNKNCKLKEEWKNSVIA